MTQFQLLGNRKSAVILKPYMNIEKRGKMESTLAWHPPDTSVASHGRSLHITLPDWQSEYTQACMDAAQLSTTIKSSQKAIDSQHHCTCYSIYV